MFKKTILGSLQYIITFQKPENDFEAKPNYICKI